LDQYKLTMDRRMQDITVPVLNLPPPTSTRRSSRPLGRADP
jgi:hypothetical protein